jgi:hypothetical protein
VPLIKEDIAEMKKAADEASVPYQIKVGEELLEAKSQLSALEWGPWLTRNFHLSASTANHWMRAASASSAGARKYETLSHAWGDDRPHHQRSWKEPVDDLVRRVKGHTRILLERSLSEEKERDLERTLALRLIDIGYKILSVELHPDKRGGSDEAMARLNSVRARLKQAA